MGSESNSHGDSPRRDRNAGKHPASSQIDNDQTFKKHREGSAQGSTTSESEDENTAAKEPAVNNSMDHTVDHQSDSFVIEIPENMDTDNQPSLPKSQNNASQGASDDHE